jgi:asparagine synthase (glutamine-hydrolysing)
MCGIAGMIGLADAGLGARMLARLAPRGPDGEGLVTVGCTVLGNTRLSLVDLAGGHQPRRANDGRLALVFNGEIYNHQDLRRTLMRAGHVFTGRSDTEVLLHCYQEWGPDCLSALEGMFAFAVSDGDSLFLARDYFGQKPLFTHLSPDRRRLLFASEAKALLADPGVSRRLDRAALFELNTFSVPLAGRSFLEDIQQIPEGGTLTVTRNQQGLLELREGRHSAPAPASLPGGESEGALVERVAARLTDSVRRQLAADHRVGVFLSSGLDSALVAAIAARERGSELATFTFADRADHPDLLMSRALTTALGVDHHESILEPEAIVASLPQSIALREIPSRVTMIEPTAAIVRRSVKAVLCGEGADELFGGYPVHVDPGSWVRRSVSSYNRMIASGQVLRKDCQRAKAVLGELTAGGPQGCRDAVYRFFLRDQLSQAHLKLWDHGSMAVGLEVRLPFLDKQLRDLALALPWSLRSRPGNQKYLLRKAAATLLPASVADAIINREKVGAPSVLRNTTTLLTDTCQRLLPPAHQAHHPLQLFAPTPELKVVLDLFVLLFVVHDGRVPEGFRLEHLYGRHLADLQDALHEAAGRRPEDEGGATGPGESTAVNRRA